jgi:hypothetical protein
VLARKPPDDAAMRRFAALRVSDGNRTRDRLYQQRERRAAGFAAQWSLESGIVRIGLDTPLSISRSIRVDPGWFRPQFRSCLGAPRLLDDGGDVPEVLRGLRPLAGDVDQLGAYRTVKSDAAVGGDQLGSPRVGPLRATGLGLRASAGICRIRAIRHRIRGRLHTRGGLSRTRRAPSSLRNPRPPHLHGGPPKVVIDRTAGDTLSSSRSTGLSDSRARHAAAFPGAWGTAPADWPGDSRPSGGAHRLGAT